MGIRGAKWSRRKAEIISEGNVPELRVKNPSLENYIYVATLAQQGRRSIPQQIEMIIEEYKKLSNGIQ